MEKIILIDAFAHIYRCFYAIQTLNNHRGEPVNALYGMARMLLNLEDVFPTSLGAVVFDKGKCTRRCAILPSYKAQRPPMPEDMKPQIPKIRSWIAAFGWPIIEKEGIEADDIIAGITAQRNTHPVVILSKDKDLTQLVCDDVSMAEPGKQGVWMQITEAQVLEKFGIPPQAVMDYLALIGDSADNIPGLQGVGPKTAVKLLEQFGSIQNMLDNLQKLENEKLRAKIRDNETQIHKNCELVQLDFSLPDDWNGLPTLKKSAPDWTKIETLADNENFSSFKTLIQKKRAAEQKKKAPEQLMLF